MERLLGTVDAAIYLLDYTKLKTVEEATLFAKLKVAPQPGLGEGLQANMHTPTSARHSAAAIPSNLQCRASTRPLHDRC